MYLLLIIVYLFIVYLMLVLHFLNLHLILHPYLYPPLLHTYFSHSVVLWHLIQLLYLHFVLSLLHFIHLLNFYLHHLDDTGQKYTSPADFLDGLFFLDPAAVISTTTGVASLATGNINEPSYLNVFLHPGTCAVFEEGGESEVKANFW